MFKESEINISGVSPEAVLKNSEPPPPLETLGVSRAKEILNIASSRQKVASSTPKAVQVTVPQLEKLLARSKDENQKSNLDKTKSIAGHVIGGAATGALGGKTIDIIRTMTSKKTPSSRFARAAELGGTLLGSAVGGAEYLRKQRKLEKSKTATISSPGMALKSSMQVAKPNISTGKIGKGIREMNSPRHIGTKFATKTASAGDEELAQTKAIVLTRADTKNHADALFGDGAKAARKADTELIAKLFLQAPAAQTMAHNLQKESSVTKNIDEYLTKHASELLPNMTEAQRNFPELLKVAAGRSAEGPKPSPNLKARSTTTDTGPNPVRSTLSGGSA